MKNTNDLQDSLITLLFWRHENSLNVRHGQFCFSQNKIVLIDWLIELILHCDTATEGCVLNDFFRYWLDDSPACFYDLHDAAYDAAIIQL